MSRLPQLTIGTTYRLCNILSGQNIVRQLENKAKRRLPSRSIVICISCPIQLAQRPLELLTTTRPEVSHIYALVTTSITKKNALPMQRQMLPAHFLSLLGKYRLGFGQFRRRLGLRPCITVILLPSRIIRDVDFILIARISIRFLRLVVQKVVLVAAVIL